MFFSFEKKNRNIFKNCWLKIFSRGKPLRSDGIHLFHVSYLNFQKKKRINKICNYNSVLLRNLACEHTAQKENKKIFFQETVNKFQSNLGLLTF